MPIQETGQRLEFTGNEIVRELSDVGTKGRLFPNVPVLTCEVTVVDCYGGRSTIRTHCQIEKLGSPLVPN